MGNPLKKIIKNLKQNSLIQNKNKIRVIIHKKHLIKITVKPVNMLNYQSITGTWPQTLESKDGEQFLATDTRQQIPKRNVKDIPYLKPIEKLTRSKMKYSLIVQDN